MSETANARATFTSMEHGTVEDWAAISTSFVEFSRQLPERVLAHLRLLEGDHGGFAVDRLTHSLQTATRAQRAGEDESTSSARWCTTSAIRSAPSITPILQRRFSSRSSATRICGW